MSFYAIQWKYLLEPKEIEIITFYVPFGEILESGSLSFPDIKTNSLNAKKQGNCRQNFMYLEGRGKKSRVIKNRIIARKKGSIGTLLERKITRFYSMETQKQRKFSLPL